MNKQGSERYLFTAAIEPIRRWSIRAPDPCNKRGGLRIGQPGFGSGRDWICLCGVRDYSSMVDSGTEKRGGGCMMHRTVTILSLGTPSCSLGRIETPPNPCRASVDLSPGVRPPFRLLKTRNLLFVCFIARTGFARVCTSRRLEAED